MENKKGFLEERQTKAVPKNLGTSKIIRYIYKIHRIYSKHNCKRKINCNFTLICRLHKRAGSTVKKDRKKKRKGHLTDPFNYKI